MSTSLYSQLPETAEMQLAKTVQEFQSEVQQQDVRSDFYQGCCFINRIILVQLASELLVLATQLIAVAAVA